MVWQLLTAVRRQFPYLSCRRVIKDNSQSSCIEKTSHLSSSSAQVVNRNSISSSIVRSQSSSKGRIIGNIYLFPTVSRRNTCSYLAIVLYKMQVIQVWKFKSFCDRASFWRMRKITFREGENQKMAYTVVLENVSQQSLQGESADL